MAESLLFELQIDGSQSIKTLAELKTELTNLKQQLNVAEIGSKAFQDLGESVKKVEQAQRELNKSFTAFKPGTIGAIKNEIQQIQAQLDKTVPGTREFDQAIRNLGERKKELLELKQAVKGAGAEFEDKVKAVAGLGQSIAGGFTIATSATVLFGEKNKDLEESIAKVQAAMALLQGIESLAGSKDAANIVKRLFLYKSLKTSVGETTIAQEGMATATKASALSFDGLKVAIAGTGIGLLVVGISELIANFDKIKESIPSKYFQIFSNIITETKERAVGFFYALVESIKPVGKLIFDYFVTPFNVAFQSAKILFDVLKNPLSLDNLKKGVGEFGNLFKETKDKLINDVNDVQNKFNEGFDKGVGIQKDREASKKRIELWEDEIKKIELLKEKNSAAGKDTTQDEINILKLKQKILIEENKKNSEEYLKNDAELQGKLEKQKDDLAKKSAENAKKRLQDVAKAEKEEQDRLSKLKEQYNKEQKAREDQLKAGESIKKENYNLQLQAVEDFYTKSIISLKQNAAEKLSVENLTSEEIKSINNKLSQDLQTAEIVKYQKLIAIKKAAGENLSAEEQALAEISLTTATDNGQKQADLVVQQQQNINAKLLELQQQYFSYLAQLGENQRQSDLDSIQRTKDKELAILDEQFKKKLINQDIYDKKKAEIEAKAEKAKRKAERDAAIRSKVLAISQIAIDVARAIAKDLNGNKAMIPFDIAIGALQTATVLAQPLPALEKGGIINVGGKTTDDVLGVNDSGYPVARVNRGEAIINANSTRMFAPILSEINAIGGGKRFAGFADGGIFNSSTPNIVVNSGNDELLQSILYRLENPVAPQISEYEITSVQNRVSKIRERASF